MIQQNFRTPLSQAKGLGSAHDGVNHWIGQRLSAIGIIPLGLLILWGLVTHASDSHSQIVKILGSPWYAATLFLFIAVVSYHAALGVQVIIEDYVHTPFWKYWLLIKTKIAAVLIPTLTLFLLIKIMFMGSN